MREKEVVLFCMFMEHNENFFHSTTLSLAQALLRFYSAKNRQAYAAGFSYYLRNYYL